MSDTPIEKFDIVKWFKGLINPVTWGKSIQYLIMICAVLFVAFAIKNTFFPSKSITNKPHAIVIGKAEKGAIDQTSTNVVVEKEKAFEVGVGVGVGRFDNKDGYAGGGWFKWKF